MTDSTEATIEFTLHGHRVSLYLPDTTDLIQKKIVQRSGFYEPMLLESIRARIRRDVLCVDVGAHLGNHTVFMAKICGAKVLSFEPQPDVFRVLQRNIEINGLQDRVTANNLALGEAPGRAVLARTLPDNTGSAQLTLDNDGQVEITTLDEQVGDREVALIKIDVEGFELEVLKGAARTIARNKPIIYAEAADGQSQKNLKAHLAPFGYLAVDQFRGTPVLAFVYCATDEDRFAAFASRFELAQRDMADRIAERVEGHVRDGTASAAVLTALKPTLDEITHSLQHQIKQQRADFSAHTYRPINHEAREVSNWQPKRASWTVPRGSEAEPFLQGMTTQTSAHPGDNIDFKLSTNRVAVFAKIRVFRLGSYGRLGGKEVHCSPPIRVPQTGIWTWKTLSADLERWQTVYRLQVAENWRPGCYMVRFETRDDKAFLHPFWVTSARPKSRTALLSSVFTHVAHNRWGSSVFQQIASRLPVQALDRFRAVRIRRPYHGSRGGHVLQHEFPFLRWADANDIRLDCLTDIEVHQRPELLASYDHVAMAGDVSYCTRELIEALQRFSQAGGKISVFGAAPGEFEVAFDPTAGTMSARTHSRSERAAWERRNAELWLTDERWNRSGEPFDLCFSEKGVSESLADTDIGIDSQSCFRGLCGDRLSSTPLGDADARLLARSRASTLTGEKGCDTTLVRTEKGGHTFVAGTNRWTWALDDLLARPGVSVYPLLCQLTAHILGNPLGASRRYPLVSVVMTSYNSEEYISNAIDSVLSQSYANLELIVVDDNSADSTFDLVLDYAKRDQRVQAFKAFQNHGTYWSKNYGITKARGQFITFQDSDDLSDPERLLLQLEPLLQNRRLVASVADYERVTESGDTIMNRGVLHRRAFPSLMIRAEIVLRRIGFLDSVRTSADQEYFHRLRRVFGVHEIAELKKPLYKAMVREGSLTQSSGARVSLDESEQATRERLSHLSGPRRRYVLAYEQWHERIDRNEASAYLGFPLGDRPFTAPPELGIDTGRTQLDLRRGAAVVEATDARAFEETSRVLGKELRQVWVFFNASEEDAKPDDDTEDLKILRTRSDADAEGVQAGFDFAFDVEPGYESADATPVDLATHCVIGIERPHDKVEQGAEGTPTRLYTMPGASQPHDFDVVLLSDFRFPGGTSFSNAEEIKAQSRSGFTTGLMQVASPVLKSDHPINPAIQRCLAAGMATLIRRSDPTRCKLLVVRHPTVLTRPTEELPRIQADRVAVIVNQPPKDRKTGTTHYNIADCHRNARYCFGTAGTWFPIGPLVRKEIKNDPGLETLSSQDWSNIINLDEWRVERRRFVSTRPVIGRHSRDAIDKWPDDTVKLLQAYPADGELQVRILGGAEYARKVLGYLPESWEVLPFGATPARDFLAGIDFFVYFHHPHWVEAFGRTVLEALASGVPVILPPHFEDLFEDAAIYAEPSGVREIVRDLYQDRHKYDERSRRGVDFVEQRFGYGAHTHRLLQQMPRPTDPTATAPPTRSGPVSPPARPPVAVQATQPSAFAHLEAKTIGSADLEPNSVIKAHIEVDGISDGARGMIWGRSRSSQKVLFEISVEGPRPSYGAYFFTDADPEQLDVMLSLEGADAQRARPGKIRFRRRADRPPQAQLVLTDTSITAALATYPARRHIVPDVIDSLVSQVDKLFVYLNNYEEIPPFIRQHPLRDRIAYIVDPASERRAAAKFCWLDTVRGYHLICDDDILYPPDYARRLVESIESHDRKAIVGVHGVVYASNIDDARLSRREVFKFPDALEREMPVHFIGTGTTALHSSVLSSMDLSQFQAYPIANDEILAVSAKNAGVPMYCVARQELWLKQHSDVKFGICEERVIDSGEHDYATELLASVNPWPELPGSQ